MPGDEAMIWPNFMKVPPRSSKLLRSGWASCDAGQCALADRAQLAQHDGSEVGATTLVMVALRRSRASWLGSGRRLG